MKNRSAVLLLIAVVFLGLSCPVNGAVEGDVKKTLNLESPPLDLAASLNGKNSRTRFQWEARLILLKLDRGKM